MEEVLSETTHGQPSRRSLEASGLAPQAAQAFSIPHSVRDADQKYDRVFPHDYPLTSTEQLPPMSVRGRKGVILWGRELPKFLCTYIGFFVLLLFWGFCACAWTPDPHDHHHDRIVPCVFLPRTFFPPFFWRAVPFFLFWLFWSPPHPPYSCRSNRPASFFRSNPFARMHNHSSPFARFAASAAASGSHSVFRLTRWVARSLPQSGALLQKKKRP